MNNARLLALGTVLACGALAPTASAATVAPTYVGGNPTCRQLDASWKEVKLDNDPAAGGHDVTDGTLSGTFTIAAGRQYASFTVAPGADAVIVKGSDAANVYVYDPDATSDDGLHAPINPNTQQPYQISHISFCYGPDAPPQGGGEPQPDPQQPTPEPASPAPSPTATPSTGQPADTPQGEVKGEQVVSGASKLSGPASCVKKAFTVKVSGRKIASVKFSIDGRTVKTIAGAGKLRINPAKYGNGLHRLTAEVRYTKASGTKSRTHRLVFERCFRQVRKPSFAG